jgi:hypothetical protein
MASDNIAECCKPHIANHPVHAAAFDEQANSLGHRISRVLAESVSGWPLDNAWRGRALLHSQAGISDDVEATPGVLIPYGTEPDPVAHVEALSPRLAYVADVQIARKWPSRRQSWAGCKNSRESLSAPASLQVKGRYVSAVPAGYSKHNA